MENESSQVTEGQFVDPLSHLALLNRSKSVSDAEAFLNFGPWWHAPLWAAFTGGLAFMNGGLWNSTNVVALDPSGGVVVTAFYGPWASNVVLITGIILAVDGYRRRVVKPKPTLKGFALTVLTLIIVLSVTLAWSVAIFAVGYENFTFGWVLFAWVIATGFFLGLLSALSRIRDNSRVASI